jgi:chromosome segregation ATPase
MGEEIVLPKKTEEGTPERDLSGLGHLEKKINALLVRFQELKKGRDLLAVALNEEKERAGRLEERLDLLSQDRERVKGRIDQLLHRLKGVDL